MFEDLKKEGVESEAKMSGKNIGMVKKKIKDVGLDMKNLIAKSFDGAAVMASEPVGVVSAIKKDSPCADYYHCAAHGLILATSKIRTISSIRNAMGTVESTATFVTDTAKREDNLNRIQLQQNKTVKKLLKVLKLSRFLSDAQQYRYFRRCFPTSLVLEAMIG